jgi:hypothetical protein
MLPHYVEIVESDEHGVIPSTPRLQFFDDRLIGSGKPLYRFTSGVFACREIGAVPANGKVRIFGCHVAIALGQSVDEDIQAAPDGVDDEADFRIDDRRRQFYIAQANNLIAHLRIKLFGPAIGGILTPGYEPGLENAELGFGPLNARVSVQDSITSLPLPMTGTSGCSSVLQSPMNVTHVLNKQGVALTNSCNERPSRLFLPGEDVRLRPGALLEVGGDSARVHVRQTRRSLAA